MADSAVSFLLNQLSVLLLEEKQLLGGLEREVTYIRDEMGQMNEFLKGAVEKDDSNTKECIRQLRDIAYDVEDVLDKYMLWYGPRRRANGLKGHVKKAYDSIKNLKVRHRIASEIKAIKYRLQNVSTSQQRYRDLNTSLDQGSSSALSKNERYDGPGDALFLDEDDVVGIEEPKKQLLEWIHSMDNGLDVISVVGMGGLGKTTLSKKVYDEESVKKHFNQHVWMVASEHKDVKHLLENLIEKLVAEIKEPPPQNMERMSVDNLREFIYGFLREKNYIIVLDDIWNISTWDAIKPALPKRVSHGCIIITTRFHNIANAACSETDHVYELKPLQSIASRELFYKKAFPRNPCPHYIRGFAENVLKRCEGLPLAISVIGGLLATKGNRAEEWEVFERSLGHELIFGGSLEILGKSLISLSYNDLPYYLKYCYLYLSIFSDDGLLEKERIIKLWIAEGFVQPKKDKTKEEVAIEYLNDLFSRSLIQVAERNVDGRARAFRIHDLLRDTIISKSSEHNIVAISDGGEMHLPSRTRRLAIQKPFSFYAETYNFEHLRSLILLCSGDVEVGIIDELVGRCRLLKVLDLRGAPLETIPDNVFKLHRLTYLSLRRTMVKVIPKSIKNLVNLETLDLKNCNVTELPVEILKLHKLRHLIVYKYKCTLDVSFENTQSFKAPSDIGRSFPHLTKLSFVEANESDGIKLVREIGKLTQLRRLGIAKLRSEDGGELCRSIAKLTNLRSLRIESAEEGETLDLDCTIRLPFLRRLDLQGCMDRVPKWISSLHGLTTLSLVWSRLSEDPLKSLQDLPNLANLLFTVACVEELSFKAQGFQKLKMLNLSHLECLTEVTVEKGCMPLLEEWHMRDCKHLTDLPQGIEHLANLRLLNFGNMAYELEERAVKQRNVEGDKWRFTHVSSFCFFSVTQDGYWGVSKRISRR